MRETCTGASVYLADVFFIPFIDTMLTLQYNELLVILMLRGRVGCLWLQSIKNLLYVKSCVCVCVIVHTSQCNMASRKRKTIRFRTEEELADAVNEIVNDSDSDRDNIPEFSSSEESESESAIESDNESIISIPALAADR